MCIRDRNNPFPGQVGGPGVVENLAVLYRPIRVDEEHETVSPIQERVQGDGEHIIVMGLVILVQELGCDPLGVRVEQEGPHVDVLIIVEDSDQSPLRGRKADVGEGLDEIGNGICRFPRIFIQYAIDDDGLADPGSSSCGPGSSFRINREKGGGGISTLLHQLGVRITRAQENQVRGEGKQRQKERDGPQSEGSPK